MVSRNSRTTQSHRDTRGNTHAAAMNGLVLLLHGVKTQCHLEALSLSRADAGVLARQRLLSCRATGQVGRQTWSGTVVVRRTLQTAVDGHSTSGWSVCSLWTGDWSEAP